MNNLIPSTILYLPTVQCPSVFVYLLYRIKSPVRKLSSLNQCSWN